MEKNAEYFRQLLQRYLKNECSPAEAEEILDWLQADSSNKLLLQRMQDEFGRAMSAKQPADAIWSDKVRQQLVGKINRQPVSRLHRINWLRMTAAASILVVISSMAWYISLHKKQLPPAVAGNSRPHPSQSNAQHKTILTLGDGTVIALDSAGNGMLSQQGNVQVVKMTNGQLTYQASPRSGASGNEHGAGVGRKDSSGGNNQSADGKAFIAMTYNTINIPRGSIYQVVLADGTRVWLNAATTLKFPTAFTGRDRVVELEGEAYFEVAKNMDKPFKVMIRSFSGMGGSGVPARPMQVEVLGTHFNVMAYGDESAIHTTLLEGSVRVSSDVSAAMLQVGQQASVGWLSGPVTVKETNMEEAIAWKRGLFQFDEAPIQSVMNQVARWYDMDIVYEGSSSGSPSGSIAGSFAGNSSGKHFTGMINRSMQLANALKIIEVAGKVHFRAEGRTITVLEK